MRRNFFFLILLSIFLSTSTLAVNWTNTYTGAWYIHGNDSDRSGTGNTMARTSATINTTSFRVGNSSLQTDATNVYATMDNGINMPLGNNNWSFVAWINLGNNHAGNQWFIMSMGSQTSDATNFAIALWDSGSPVIQLTGSGSQTYTKTIPKNAWTMIGVTYRSSDNNATVYINGTLLDSKIIGWTPNLCSGATGASCGVTLGARRWNLAGGNGFPGSINDARVLNGTVLTPAQISYYYNSTSGVERLQLEEDAITNFSISANNLFNSSAIQVFNATVNGTFYSTTNGLLYTGIPLSSGQILNISVKARRHFDYNTTYNVSSSLTANMYEAKLTISAKNIISNTSVSGNFSSGTQKNETTLFLNEGNMNITFSRAGYYNLSKIVSVTALTDIGYNFTGVYDQYINITARETISGSAINTFNVTVELTNTSYSGYTTAIGTTNGNVIIPSITGKYEITIDNPSYELKTVTVNSSGVYTAYQFSLFTTNSIALSFYNEVTNTILNGTAVSVELIGSYFAENYTTTNGTLFVDLITPSEYTIRYSASGFGERFYFFNLQNRTTNNITLYLLSQSNLTEITATVIDESIQNVEDAYIKVLKYNINTNSYELKEVARTNSQGIAKFDVELNSEFYIFIIEKPLGTTRLQTSPAYVYSSTISFQIELAQQVAQNFFNSIGIDHYLILNNVTNVATFYYNDENSLISEGCLRISAFESSNYRLVSETCSTGSSGIITYNLTAINGTTYLLQSIVNINGEDTILDSIIKTFQSNTTTGRLGLFLAFLLGIAFLSIATKSVSIVTILIPVSMIIASSLKLIVIPMFYLVPILLVGVILAMILSKK